MATRKSQLDRLTTEASLFGSILSGAAPDQNETPDVIPGPEGPERAGGGDLVDEAPGGTGDHPAPAPAVGSGGAGICIDDDGQLDLKTLVRNYLQRQAQLRRAGGRG
jgi:hypothetical protein